MQCRFGSIHKFCMTTRRFGVHYALSTGLRLIYIFSGLVCSLNGFGLGFCMFLDFVSRGYGYLWQDILFWVTCYPCISDFCRLNGNLLDTLIWQIWTHKNIVIFAFEEAAQTYCNIACKAWFQVTIYIRLDWNQLCQCCNLLSAATQRKFTNCFVRTSLGVHPIGPKIDQDNIIIPSILDLALLHSYYCLEFDDNSSQGRFLLVSRLF